MRNFSSAKTIAQGKTPVLHYIIIMFASFCAWPQTVTSQIPTNKGQTVCMNALYNSLQR